MIGMTPREDFDPLAPQREAAMFYGLFLRGHSADTLRRDIDVPKPLLQKWLNARRYETGFRNSLKRVYQYRKQVLAIFDELVLNERTVRAFSSSPPNHTPVPFTLNEDETHSLSVGPGGRRRSPLRRLTSFPIQRVPSTPSAPPQLPKS